MWWETKTLKITNIVNPGRSVEHHELLSIELVKFLLGIAVVWMIISSKYSYIKP